MKCKRVLYFLAYLSLFGITIYLLPSFWCGRDASKWFHDDLASQASLAKGVETWFNKSISGNDYKTRSSLFNGEWLFGTYMMSGMGYGQMAILHPEKKRYYLLQMEKCIDKILSEEVKAFDENSWRQDPLSFINSEAIQRRGINEKWDINSAGDHAAYLGYLNLLLSFHHYLDKNSRFAILNDKISQFLAERLKKSPLFLLYTYPGELYVTDNCAVVGSLGLYGKAVRNDEYCKLAYTWTDRCRKDYMDKKTGLLFQSISECGSSRDSPRGSGTTLGLYYVSFADIDFSKELYGAVQKELMTTFAGFLAVREYPRNIQKGGDIDSGPVIFGMGFSATGFSVGGAKIFNDINSFKKLYALTYMFGTPLTRNGARSYITGGPLGTAIMFAVMTALPEEMMRKL